MADFDHIKAEMEILNGMTDVIKVITVRMRDAERRLGEAEADYTALAKIGAWAKGAIEQQQAKVRALREAAEKAGLL